jgi:hypothetical protein
MINTMKISLISLVLMSLLGCAKDDSTTAAATTTFRLKGSASATASKPGEGLDTLAASGSPTYVAVKILGIWLSENTDCSDPVLVKENSAADYVDMTENPTLIEGSPADGTYNCLIVKQSDNIRFKADQTAVDAHAGCADTDTTYTFDTAREGSTLVDLDGTVTNATGTAATPGEDTQYVFITTDPTALSSPYSDHGMTLTSALEVPGNLTLYVDFTDQISNNTDDGGNYCWVEQPAVGFR